MSFKEAKKTRLKQHNQFHQSVLEGSMIRSITTSCPDDEALDRRHGRAAVHVAMRQHRQHISLRSATSQPTRRHDVEGPPDVSAVDYNDDEQSWRRHPQLHAPHPSSSRTVASRAQAGTSLYGKNGMLVPAAGARVRNWMAPYSRRGSQRHHSSRTRRN